jgi:hypothetical protein
VRDSNGLRWTSNGLQALAEYRAGGKGEASHAAH